MYVTVGNNKILLVLFSLATLAVMYVCLHVIGGTAALIALIVYAFLLGASIIGIVAQLFDPAVIGMNVGISIENGKDTMKMEKYDEYLAKYESKHTSFDYWVSVVIALLWITLLLTAGANLLVYMTIIAIFANEIGKYRVYKCIKENKDSWGAAMYIHEIQNFVEEKVSKEKKKCLK